MIATKKVFLRARANEMAYSTLASTRTEKINSHGEQLFAALRAKEISEEEAQDQLYRLLRQPILTYLVAQFHGIDDAEDIFHDFFYRFIRDLKKKQYDFSKPLWPFVRRAVKNAAIDKLRARKRKNETSLEEEQDGTMLSDLKRSQAKAIEMSAMLREVLGQLKPAQNRVLSMLVFEGLTEEEIAKRLNMERPAIHQRILRARRRLRKIWLTKKVEES